MFSFHKIVNLLNNTIKNLSTIKYINNCNNLNKSELIINIYLKLKFFKQSYYVTLLYVVLQNNYNFLNEFLSNNNILYVFSLKNAKAQIAVLTLINQKLNNSKYSFLNKIIILLKVFYQILVTELLSFNFLKHKFIIYIKKYKSMFNLIILEYKFSYLTLTKLKLNNKYLLFNNKYTTTLNYFISSYAFKPLFKFLVNLNSYLSFLRIYNFIKTVAIPVIVSLFMLFLLINFFKIEIYTNIGIWCVLGFFFLWLMSGFNFFIKRYKNGKFTSAIQRFWKRTNSYFWLVEGFLFTLFFYYYLNSSQEPLYMYDESNLNQLFLPNLVTFFFTIIIIIIIIFYSYYLILNIPTMSSKQQILHLVINSVLMIYIFLLESYQFYYLISTFFEITWDYSEDFKLWVLEQENPKIRVKTQYLTLALIAKYWHFIFIFFTWLFLLYKSYERKKIYYPIFGFVIQNCIILLLLNMLFCVQWTKWIFRRYYDTVYYWFFTDSNNLYSIEFIDLFSIFSLF